MSDPEYDEALHDRLAKRAAVSLLLLLLFAAAQIVPCVSDDPLIVSLFSPYPSGVTLTSGPVYLVVEYRDGTSGPLVMGVPTEFYVEVPGSSSFALAGYESSGSDGHASLTYSPPFAGSYQWYVNYTEAGEEMRYPASPTTWMFSCAIATTTLTQTTTYTAVPTTTTAYTTIQTTTSTQWTTTRTTVLTTTSTQWTTTQTTLPTTTLSQWTTQTYTQTVGIITNFSYLYETATSTTTAYTTQTISRTSTISLPTTLTRTSTAFATTQTTPVTYYETESTTLTEMSYATMSLTQYVYLASYAEGQVLEKATIQQIPNGSNASAHFHNDKHNVETITIGVIDNATNVEITVAKAPEHTNVGMNTNEYGSFEIFATNLSEDNVKSVVIEFKVEKNWLSINQVPQDKVNLYRYENGKWTKLETSLLRTDETYAYYKATSPGLSVFAIAGQSSSFFQIPGVGSIANSYLVILSTIIVAILGAYVAIRIKKARSKKEKEENVSQPVPTDASSEDRIEGKLLDYITNHGGSISLSKAAEDLGVLPTTIKEAIGKLKSEGKLAPV